MKRLAYKNILFSIPFIFLFLSCARDDIESVETFTGIDLLEESTSLSVNEAVLQYMLRYRYLVIGVVENDQTVLTRSFGSDHLNDREQYASVSKPVTANICFQLWQDGMINSLLDPISDYDEKYADAQPDEYSDPKISFVHLLTHTSGVVHLDDLWKKGKLNMLFSPGRNTEYSTKGFGILGDVMETIAGEKYSLLVDKYISEPINGSSFYCYPLVQTTPGAGILSDIEDFANFARASMDGTYYPRDFLIETVLQPYSESPNGTIGLGWFVLEHEGRMLGYHAGSNGKPRAFILIDPENQSAIVLLGRNYEEKAKTDLHILALDVLNIVNYL